MQPLLAGLTFLAVCGPAGAAGFTCAKAATADEHMVCDDRRLSRLDGLLARVYARAKEGPAAAEAPQIARDFLADRKACGGDAACILSTYVAVIGALTLGDERPEDLPEITAETIAGGAAPESKALPQAIGRCATTRVSSVHPRLGEEGVPPTDEDFDAGTGINFDNDGYQVSYNREEALIASRPGDKVVMCLISVPHHCPPGDDRGREYRVSNTRTGQTWTLPDSQHLCGGA